MSFSIDDPEALLAEALARFHPRLLLAASFSREDVLLIGMAAGIDPSVRVVALDTGRLPEETLLCAETLVRQLDVRIEWLFPERAAVEALLRDQGPFGMRDGLEQRHRCCQVRKVDPLARALGGVDAWITGRRREQAVTRRALPVVEESPGAPLKLNPLATWTAAQVEAELKARRLPDHPLFRQGYASIGCAPCTRPIEPGEDERAGRWWWEDPEHKECGLHPRQARRSSPALPIHGGAR